MEEEERELRETQGGERERRSLRRRTEIVNRGDANSPASRKVKRSDPEKRGEKVLRVLNSRCVSVMNYCRQLERFVPIGTITRESNVSKQVYYYLSSARLLIRHLPCMRTRDFLFLPTERDEKKKKKRLSL